MSIDALSESPEAEARNVLASGIIWDDGLPQGHLTVIDGELTDYYEDDEREADQLE